MPRDTLTGSRIRERRMMIGIKQADLARKANISASYLNLIEHNRRRIGGKLLLDIAALLKVEPANLTEGAAATLIATLREAASDARSAVVEIDRVDEFAGRFPGWARLLAESRERIADLERTVEALTDRMTHDPHLATSLHEMLSTVTAIRSTASILAEPGEIDADWQERFHRNVFEDSERLAETSRALVTYLEAADDAGAEISAPQEEANAVIAGRDHHFPELEEAARSAEDLTAELGKGLSKSARALLLRTLRRYAGDAAAMPLQDSLAAVARLGADPLALSRSFGTDPARAMRRLATLPPDALVDPVGLAICDASGVLTYRKPLPDFPLPRFGAGCPLWPLYTALGRPLVVLSDLLEQPGRQIHAFRAFAVAQPVGPAQLDRDPLLEAHMLFVTRPAPADPGGTRPVGVSCRICSRTGCPGRREPSILGEAAAEEF